MNSNVHIVQQNSCSLEESIYDEIDELTSSEPATSTRNSYFSVHDNDYINHSKGNIANNEESIDIDEFMPSCTSVAYTNHSNQESSTRKQDFDDDILDDINDRTIPDTNDDLVHGDDNGDDNSDNDANIESTDMEGYLSPYHALSAIRDKQDYE